MNPSHNSLQPAGYGPLIDSHVHIFHRGMPLVPEPRHQPTYDFTIENLLTVMDQYDVSHAVIAAASPWGDFNDYTQEALRESSRLRGTAIVQAGVERLVLDDLARSGFVGIRLSAISMKSLPDLDSWEYRKLLRRLVDLDWHVHVHASNEQLPALLPALQRSGVKIVVDHLGRPGKDDHPDSPGCRALIKAMAAGQTWVKFSGAYRLGSQARDFARFLVSEMGCDRLLWASDCPFVGEESHMNYQASIDWLLETIPDPVQRRRVFYENALRFYFD